MSMMRTKVGIGQNAAIGSPADSALTTRLSIAGGTKAFGEVTPEEARAQGEKLKALTGFGPTMRVRPVAHAWSELAELMVERDAAGVSDLDAATVADFARRLWVVPSGESLMQDPKD